MIHVIRPDELPTMLFAATGPLMIVYIDEPQRHPDQVEIVQALWKHEDLDLNLCLVNNAWVNSINGAISLEGSPSYVLVSNNQVVAEHTGKISMQALNRMIDSIQ